MTTRAQQVKDREKLHAEDFAEVKKSVICQAYGFSCLHFCGRGLLLPQLRVELAMIFMAMGGVGALSLLAIFWHHGGQV